MKIEFRAWDKETEFFRDEENVFINQAGGIYREDEAEWYGDRYEIELFTGFEDKNGKKVYDGDLCQDDGNLYQVVWVEDHAEWGMKVIKTNCCLSRGLTFPLWQYLAVGVCRAVVVGNVHENPELLGVAL